jgi:hypothetical protein
MQKTQRGTHRDLGVVSQSHRAAGQPSIGSIINIITHVHICRMVLHTFHTAIRNYDHTSVAMVVGEYTGSRTGSQYRYGTGNSPDGSHGGNGSLFVEKPGGGG